MIFVRLAMKRCSLDFLWVQNLAINSRKSQFSIASQRIDHENVSVISLTNILNKFLMIRCDTDHFVVSGAGSTRYLFSAVSNQRSALRLTKDFSRNLSRSVSGIELIPQEYEYPLYSTCVHSCDDRCQKYIFPGICDRTVSFNTGTLEMAINLHTSFIRIKNGEYGAGTACTYPGTL